MRNSEPERVQYRREPHKPHQISAAPVAHRGNYTITSPLTFPTRSWLLTVIVTVTMTLPSIQLNYDSLKQRLNAFQDRFISHLEVDKQKLIEESTAFAKAEAAYREEGENLMAQIELAKQEKEERAKVRQNQRRVVDENREVVSNYTARVHELTENNQETARKVEELRGQIDKTRQKINSKKKFYRSQIELDDPEAEFWERLLGMRLEAVQQDLIRIIFTGLDSHNLDRECSFVLDLSHHDGKVTECEPVLDAAVVDKAVNGLNESRDYAVFLSDMRRAFRAIF
uniref:Kinetochore protein SPC25 n=1 Tax=Blastobotrys adeninivorans TaxID=409370 RepID=A0A060T6U0_BLAAD